MTTNRQRRIADFEKSVSVFTKEVMSFLETADPGDVPKSLSDKVAAKPDGYDLEAWLYGEAKPVIYYATVTSSKLHKIYERQCNGHQTYNGDWDEVAASRDEKRADEIEREIKASFHAFGIKAHINGDPRGNPVGFYCPLTRQHNGWGDDWRLAKGNPFRHSN